MEILIGIALFAIAGSVFGIKTYRAVQQTRYRADVARVARLLQTAQTMSVVQRGIVEVVFRRKEGVLTMFCAPAVSYPVPLGKRFLERDFPLRAVCELYHDGERLGEGDEWVVKFNRFDGAFRMAGVFSFGRKRGEKEEECPLHLVLRTYPAPLTPITERPKSQPSQFLAEESRTLYPQRLERDNVT